MNNHDNTDNNYNNDNLYKISNPFPVLIPFNKPYLTGNELNYIQEAVNLGKISGNGEFTRRCQSFFEQRYGFHKCLLTTSCTDALEMAAILLDIQPGDEVILPSYTFVSSANSFVLRGAKMVFIDSKPNHPNLDETLLEGLITPKTKAIVVVHYGGLACEMDAIMEIANRHGLFVVEDAAQAIDSFYKGKALGGIGHLGCFSFHETKNLQCGEGGMLVINDPRFVKRAEIIWEKGTDRAAFFRGEIDKYGWVDVGSSFLPSEVTAAFLWAQLENLDRIQAKRKASWELYHQAFSDGAQVGKEKNAFSFTVPPITFLANAHLFFLVFDTLESRQKAIETLKAHDILGVFHYQSLHRSSYIQNTLTDQPFQNLPHADRFSDCLLRLPLYYELKDSDVIQIAGLLLT
jgi:dTDP-4-amino-4,6-dideoxygalactose transaminase